MDEIRITPNVSESHSVVHACQNKLNRFAPVGPLRNQRRNGSFFIEIIDWIDVILKKKKKSNKISIGQFAETF